MDHNNIMDHNNSSDSDAASNVSDAASNASNASSDVSNILEDKIKLINNNYKTKEAIDKLLNKNNEEDEQLKKGFPIVEYSLKNINPNDQIYLKTYFQEILFNNYLYNDLTVSHYIDQSNFIVLFNSYKNYQQVEYRFLQSLYTFGRNFYPSNKPIYDFKILTETFQLINEQIDDFGETEISNIYLNSFINLLNYKKMVNNYTYDLKTETLVKNLLVMFKMFLSLNSSKSIYNLLIFESNKFMKTSNIEIEEFMTPYDILRKVFSNSDTWSNFLDIVLKIKKQFENFIFDAQVLLSYESLYDFETYNKCATILYVIFKKFITLDICKEILREHSETIEKFISKQNIEKSKTTLNIIIIYFICLLASSLNL